jgi:hypothetical protein
LRISDSAESFCFFGFPAPDDDDGGVDDLRSTVVDRFFPVNRSNTEDVEAEDPRKPNPAEPTLVPLPDSRGEAEFLPPPPPSAGSLFEFEFDEVGSSTRPSWSKFHLESLS